jgi:predicted nucleic-acid-binding Zn-ribbon protein
MSIVQLIECSKCGYSESIPDSQKVKTPWDIWKNGCPKCGCSKVDVTIVLDRTGRIQDIKRVEKK